jgi:hypothetical protein
MKSRGHWEYAGVKIPGHWINDKTSPDGKRFVATAHGWSMLRVAKYRVTGGTCHLRHPGCLVRMTLDSSDLHHTGVHGRGLGGSWRDDRVTEIACRPCHRWKEHRKDGWSSACENSQRQDNLRSADSSSLPGPRRAASSCPKA